MKREMSINNVSFNFLKGSSEFLNLLLENLTSCVVLLNEKIELQAYNDALKTIFSNKKDEYILYQRCGEVINCAYAIDEQKDCGTTSQCTNCELRISAMQSYLNNVNIYKQRVCRPYYTTEGKKVIKDLQFSTRLFHFDKEKYVLMLIEDISPLVELEKKVKKMEEQNNV